MFFYFKFQNLIFFLLASTRLIQVAFNTYNSSKMDDELIVEFHQFGMFATWTVLFNIMIILIQFKSFKYTILVHTIIGVVIGIATLAFILDLLIPFGWQFTIQDDGFQQYVHSLVGLIFLGLIVIQIALGFWAKFGRQSKTASPKQVHVRNGIHKVLGYIIGFGIKISVLIETYGYPFFYPVLGTQIFFIILFLFFKIVWKPKVQSVVVYQPLWNQNYAEIKDIQEIKSFRKKVQKYFIVSDYIFDMEPLQQVHPGGAKILQPLQGRQLDRFVYGMYSSEFNPEIKPYSHSKSFLQLIPRPIAKIVYPNPYSKVWPQISEVLQVNIKFYERINKDETIYMLALQTISSDDSFVFLGFSSLKQIGQYHSLTLNQTCTRLYTSVNCLNQKNIAFLKKILKLKQNTRFITIKKRRENQQTKENTIVTSMLDGSHAQNPEKVNNFLPILLKIYDKGKLTKQLKLNQFTNCHLQLSVPRGKGLELDKTSQGHILTVCGGTGLFPFMDFIDLKFKARLIKEKSSLKEQVLSNDPVLADHDFNKWRMTILLAVNDISDIHPLTLQQLSYLSDFKNELRCVIKTRSTPGAQDSYKNFEFTNDRFDARIQSQIHSGDLVRVWLCGPPCMNQNVVNRLQTLKSFDMAKLLIV